ncbi:MAG: hypothetical protein C5B50_02490 [Verrucomicrobia bacterium]|nr:MAG: hypothetical protein C5B50_02490 [Verrucomicrobiota bacterium]
MNFVVNFVEVLSIEHLVFFRSPTSPLPLAAFSSFAISIFHLLSPILHLPPIGYWLSAIRYHAAPWNLKVGC